MRHFHVLFSARSTAYGRHTTLISTGRQAARRRAHRTEENLICVNTTDIDDNSDKESEYEERSPDDSPSITKKSLSTVGFRSSPECDAARPLALRATQSFTGAVEELRLCGNFQRINLCNRMNSMSTPKIAAVCPCGCLLRPAVTGPFRTREQNTLALHVVSPEVLNYHGYCFEPKQIAMFWKKDCRMFLWKGKAKQKNVIHAESHKKVS